MAAAMLHPKKGASAPARPLWAVIAVVWAVASLNCSNNMDGIGIGRQPIPTPPARTPALPLTFVELYAADPDPAQHYVEVLNATTDAVGIDGLNLCKDLTSPCTPVGGSVAAGARLSLSLETLGVLPQAGEVALVNADGEALVYLAWGGDPTISNSPLFLAAYYSGAWTPGTFAPASFPSPTGFASVLEGGEAGCAAPTRDAAPLVPVPVCPVNTRVLRITEVGPSFGVAGFSSFVEVENISANPVDTKGVLLCVDAPCVAVGDDLIAPGERRFVVLREAAPTDIDGNPTPAPGALYQPSAPELPDSAEITLLAPGGRSIEQGRIQSFVRYGADAPTTTGVLAVAAGLWAADTDAAPAPAWPTDSVIRDPVGDPATDLGAAGWFLAKRSPGAVDMLPAVAPWELCTEGDPAVIAGLPTRDLIITAVARLDATRSVVYLENSTATDLPLTDITVSLGASALALPAGPVAAGEQAGLLLGTDADCMGDALTTFQEEATSQNPTGNTAPLATACTTVTVSTSEGELTVASSMIANDYLQWGTTPAPPGESAAIAAGLWPATACNQLALAELDALVLSDVTSDGNTPSSYARAELQPLPTE